jgi:cysteine desulfurase
MRRIYLDCHATTPLRREALEAMEPYLHEKFANPASETHAEGLEAAEAVEIARDRVAKLVGAQPGEVVFTSGATEADNWAIKAAAWSRRSGKNHLITCAIEHKAVLEPARWLGRQGIRLTVIPVDALGRVEPDAVAEAIDDSTFLVSIQMANSEIGTIQPVAEIARITRKQGVLFHVDAAQAAGRLVIRMEEQGFDLLSLSAHKMYGPKGTGALVVRRKVRMEPLLHGGGQERGRRSGTVNVAGVVGFGAACAIACTEQHQEPRRIAALRDRLWDGIRSSIPNVRRNGDPEHALPNNLNVTFEGVYAQTLIQALKTIAVSSGSACASANPEPSHVLRAIGLTDDQADASIRFGLGRDNTESEIDEVTAALRREVEHLRALISAGS